MSISLTINPQQVANRILTRDVKYYANSRTQAYCDPYVPFRDGNLSQNVTITDEYVQYNSPYAHRIYNGIDFNFSKDIHPLATAQWNRTMAAAKGQQLADDITEYIKRGER